MSIPTIQSIKGYELQELLGFPPLEKRAIVQNYDHE